MTTDRDPLLESLFAAARQDLAGDEFADDVMLRIDKLRRRAIIGWIFVGLVAAAIALVLSGPIVHAVNLATQILPESLVELDDRRLVQVFAPLNSVAGVVGLGLLGLRMAYRKIFSPR
ncbi:MAG: hypothetical protein OEM85_16005 [Gammaproteobacteria bacterium]|nr:hypothetical protein [Gammaproteobacteria bacterium]MDH3410072.1 hypothetical protein [Gammaproteobacteria bacterium]